MEKTIITKILALLKGITVSEAIKILFEVRREINDQTTIDKITVPQELIDHNRSV